MGSQKLKMVMNEIPRWKQRGIFKGSERPKGWRIQP